MATTKKKAAPKKKEYKLDIFRVLDQINAGNLDFYASLSDDEKKAFQPLVIMRWASSVQNKSRGEQEHMLSWMNNMVNCNFWEITKHPELLWKLMALHGFGEKSNYRFKWIPMAAKTSAAGKMTALLLAAYPYANSDELEMMREMNTKDDYIEMAKSLAWDDKAMKALKAELKKNGKT